MTTLSDRFHTALQEVLQNIDTSMVPAPEFVFTDDVEDQQTLTPDVAVKLGRMVLFTPEAWEDYPDGAIAQTTLAEPVVEPNQTGWDDLPPCNEYYLQHHYRCLCCGAETVQGFKGRIIHHQQAMALIGVYRSYVGEYVEPAVDDEPVFRLAQLRKALRHELQAQLLAEAAA